MHGAGQRFAGGHTPAPGTPDARCHAAGGQPIHAVGQITALLVPVITTTVSIVNTTPGALDPGKRPVQQCVPPPSRPVLVDEDARTTPRPI